ncbi:MAG: helix-turn-helix domain-containing protein [Chloroflexi bacterium]|nr:helix-turn-helix domain-containing protein [Chloroflexota bacterium]
MPSPKATEVNLTEEEQSLLEELIRRHNIGQQIALRARIVLFAGQGQTNSVIVKQLGVNIKTVRNWRNRWVQGQGISLEDLSAEERLQDLPRSGAPARITADQRCKIEALACEMPEHSDRPISQWTAREIADEVIKRKIVESISSRHAARLLKRC